MLTPSNEADLYTAIGEIRSDVKKLLKNGDGYDKRISWLEHKVYLVSGSAATIGMFIPLAIAKAMGWH